jgi:hypothetical protein
MRNSRKSLVRIGLIIFLAILIFEGLEFGTKYLGFTSSAVFRSIGVIAVAIISFYGFLWYGTQRHGSIDEGDMRGAITVAVVTVYLVLVGFVAFYRPISEDAGLKLPEITSTMISSFTTLVGIIVPFYFGTSAYVQAKREEKQKDSATDASEEPAKEQKGIDG